MTDRRERRVNRSIAKMQKRYGGSGKPKKLRREARRYFKSLPASEQQAERAKYQRLLGTTNETAIAEASMAGLERKG